ncbi:unnamed protein product [Kuraishia capsulata CBS 1993]|uniref:Uncharacterized protein n=1 Tax=Kuraishia capsulata CBS 1993 TaxID=1382522 RepID=W6MT74_9ASCO|nr:uncharacterized protein KUCA_T00006011001 [Kuraishia capsulata CBS 1993]CDK30016.1 unnamed protein product [Kuraishia capsulata CBS 1993]
MAQLLADSASSLLDLPVEITRRIMKLCPRELKGTCKSFYVMYNEMYYHRMVEEMGSGVIYTIGVHALPHIVKYVRSFDYWRGTLRKMIADYCRLPEYDESESRNKTPIDSINCTYIADSWSLVYSLFKNRRLFVEYTDYQVDEPMNYIYRHILQINKTYLLHYKKTIKISADVYNLSCGIIIQNALGLGTIKFQVVDHRTGEPLLTYYPPTNINEMLPRNKFSLLDLGNFEVNADTYVSSDESLVQDRLVEVDIIMEETGLYIKSGFSMCFIDVNAYPRKSGSDLSVSKVKKEKWLFWTIDNQEPTPDKVINLLLRNCYKAINNGLTRALPRSASNYNFKRIGSYAESMFNQGVARLSHLETTKEEDEHVNGDANGSNDNSNDDAISMHSEIMAEFDEVENPDGYNKSFYSRFNDAGELITKTVKFDTVVDLREYEVDVSLARKRAQERLAQYTPEDAQEIRRYIEESPLKWKLPTLFEF